VDVTEFGVQPGRQQHGACRGQCVEAARHAYDESNLPST
jgi:hypothetical protein